MKIIEITHTRSVFIRPTIQRDFTKGQRFAVLSAGDAAPEDMERLTHAEADAVTASGTGEEITDGSDRGAGSSGAEAEGAGPGGDGGGQRPGRARRG